MNDNVKTILCKVIGSPKMGMGHIYRSLGLARILEKEFKVIFHINNNAGLSKILKEQCITYFVDENIEELVSKQEVDLLLFDQLSSDNGLFETLKSHFSHLKIIALDYFDYDNRFIDVIINLFNQNLNDSMPIRDNLQYYEGTEYAIIRDEFNKHIVDRRNISPEVKNVLITFGGADPNGNTKKVLQLFKDTGIPDINIDVILGPLWRSELPQDLPSNIRFHHSISNMSYYMTRADLAFSGAGTTMMELLSVGTPTIVMPQNLWEKRFARNIEEKGAVRVLNYESPIKEDVGDFFYLTNSYEKRKSLSQKGKTLVDGRGKERIYKIIYNNLYNGE
ncbi:MAG: glycosyltransferase [Candidatus Methanoperedens sp.]|nr:glycosyltransferase [Candidatus Methanoperedens sp.]CAG0969922.1 hypothetical protein METP1_01176 [Methanosarcinales archaeon]